MVASNAVYTYSNHDRIYTECSCTRDYEHVNAANQMPTTEDTTHVYSTPDNNRYYVSEILRNAQDKSMIRLTSRNNDVDRDAASCMTFRSTGGWSGVDGGGDEKSVWPYHLGCLIILLMYQIKPRPPRTI